MPKGGLIPDKTTVSKKLWLKVGIPKKDLLLIDKPASYPFVGGVKAHQDDDG